MITFGSLFTGVGGFDLGFERAGFECRWQSEIDQYCLRVLNRRWPNVRQIGNIKKVKWNDIEKVDCIIGGFPCQPVSVAGKGQAQNDPRWLWPWFARAVRALRPRYVAVENVPGLLVRGMGDVLGDLAALGYDAEWQVLPAAAFGAPHIRERVFILGYPGSGRRGGKPRGRAGQEPENGHSQMEKRDMADTDRERFKKQRLPIAIEKKQSRPECESHVPDANHQRSQGGEFEFAWSSILATQLANSRGEISYPDANGGRLQERAQFDGHKKQNSADWHSCGRHTDGLCDETPGEPEHVWSTEPDVGRVANGVPARVDRLRALGNAIVPQVAEYIALVIREHFERSQ